MERATDAEAMKAYVTWIGDGERWAAHVERSDDDPSGEFSEHLTATDAVAWARERRTGFSS